jgi:hypothetical protein
MSSQPAQAIPGQVLRHWSIDSRQSVGGLQWPAPDLAYAERADGGKLLHLASKLARVKSELRLRNR